MSITLVVGDNGTLTKAQKATTETNKASIKEELELEISNMQLEAIENNEELTKEKIVDELKTNKGLLVVDYTDKTINGKYKDYQIFVVENIRVTVGERGESEEEYIREEFYIGENVASDSNTNNYPTYLANIEEAQNLIKLIQAETSKLSSYGALKNRLDYLKNDLVFDESADSNIRDTDMAEGMDSNIIDAGMADEMSSGFKINREHENMNSTLTLHRYSIGEDIEININDKNDIENALKILEEESELIINNFEYNGHKILKNGAIVHVVYGDYGQRELVINFRRASLELAALDSAEMNIYSTGYLAHNNLEIAKYFISGVCDILNSEESYSDEQIEAKIGEKGAETIRKYMESYLLSPMLADGSIEGGKIFSFFLESDNPLGDKYFTEETSKKFAEMSNSEFDKAVEIYFSSINTFALSPSDSTESEEEIRRKISMWKNAHVNYIDSKEFINVIELELDRIAKEANYYKTGKKIIDGTYGNNIPSLTIKDLGLTGTESLLPISVREASITRIRNGLSILDETISKLNNLSK